MTTHLLTEIEVPESKHYQMLEAHYFDTSTHCLQKEKLACNILFAVKVNSGLQR